MVRSGAVEASEEEEAQQPVEVAACGGEAAGGIGDRRPLGGSRAGLRQWVGGAHAGMSGRDGGSCFVSGEDGFFLGAGEDGFN